jgi:HD-GYP domain-containing protein (c-di-GMP phosphodiesterase class II)
VAIVSVADSLDAIAGERPYRKSHTFPEALQVMEESATLYHRPALDAARELVASNRLSGREFHSSLSLERSH